MSVGVVKCWYLVNRRKLFCIMSILVAVVFLGYFFLVSLILGFLASKLGGGKKSGEKGRVKSILIPFGKRKIHVHHWIIALLLIPVGFFVYVPLLPPVIICGFLSGIAFQGIYSYRDWHKIVIPRHGNREICGAEKGAVLKAQPD